LHTAEDVVSIALPQPFWSRGWRKEAVRDLVGETEKTKRRVKALEYVVIPC
jgi:hypothetical protein